jgi:8-oxo-dGTP pyrophosphatase MutT (NUDIX family)
MSGKKDCDAAAIEAMEEAGVIGTVEPHPIGAYTYFKRRDFNFDIVEVSVYRLIFDKHLDDWPERNERHVRWFRPSLAAELVQEPGLSSILFSLV